MDEEKYKHLLEEDYHKFSNPEMRRKVVEVICEDLNMNEEDLSKGNKGFRKSGWYKLGKHFNVFD